MVNPTTSSNEGRTRYTEVTLPILNEKNKVFINLNRNYTFYDKGLLHAINDTENYYKRSQIISTANFTYNYREHKLLSYVLNGVMFIDESYYARLYEDRTIRRDYISIGKFVPVTSLDCFLDKKFEFQSRSQKKYVIHQFKEYLKQQE